MVKKGEDDGFSGKGGGGREVLQKLHEITCIFFYGRVLYKNTEKVVCRALIGIR